jgi:hypothetical protein
MLQADWVSVLELRRLSPRLAAEEVAYKPGSHVRALERREVCRPFDPDGPGAVDAPHQPLGDRVDVRLVELSHGH